MELNFLRSYNEVWTSNTSIPADRRTWRRILLDAARPGQAYLERAGIGDDKEREGPLPLGNRGVIHMPVTPTYPGVYIEEIPSIRGSMRGSIP